MLLHPIYQQLLEGGYDRLVLSAKYATAPYLLATTGRRLRPPILLVATERMV